MGESARLTQRIRAFMVGLTVVVGSLVYLSAPAFAAPETPVAQTPTGVTGNSAILHGELNPGQAGEPGEYQFIYKVSTEACRPEAEFIPEPPAASAGNAKEAVSIEATNLEPNQTYAFCVLALKSGEEAQSPALTFKTLATAKPYVFPNTTTAPVTTPFAATLEAQVNPEKEQTSYLFEYATNEGLTGAITVPGAEELGPEFGELTASVNTGGVLTPSTTYYFRVSATNKTGTTRGPVEQFTTAEAKAPEVISEKVAALNSDEPKLEAKINPSYEETTYQFEYSTKESGGELTGSIKVLNGASPLPAVSEELEAGPVGLPGLEAGVTYYYRVVATNFTGTTAGAVESFRALGVPAIGASSSREVTRTTAIISGSVIPQGLPSSYHVIYVPQASFEENSADPYAHGRSTYDTKLEGQGYVPVPVEVALEELEPETTYHYALVGSNELGVARSVDGTFTTSAHTPPSASTGAATGVSELSATINALVDTQGLQTVSSFELGTSPGGGSLVAATVSGEGTMLSVSASFNGQLLPGTTYYYRAVATNRDGTSYGAYQSFTTAGPVASLATPLTPSVVPYSGIAQLNAKEAAETPKPPKPPTRAQLLTKALKVCQKKPKRQRAACQRQAHKKYGPKKAAKHK